MHTQLRRTSTIELGEARFSPTSENPTIVRTILALAWCGRTYSSSFKTGANGVQLMRRPAHSNSKFFLVCQLSVICARPHYVGSWLGELCRRDGFAVFHLNGGGIKGDRRRPPPEKPIDTESL